MGQARTVWIERAAGVTPRLRAAAAFLMAARFGPPAALLTIRRKIVLAFLATATITAGFGAYAIHNNGVTGALMTATFDRILISLDYARGASSDFAALQAAMLREHVTGMAAEPSVEALAIEVRDDLRIAGERALSDNARAAAAAADAALTGWMDKRPSGRDVPIVWATFDQKVAVVNESLDQLVNITSGDGFRHRQAARLLVSQSRWLGALATLLMVLLAALVATMLSRQIMGPLRAASAAARRIAAGEWAAHIPRDLTQARDEFGTLLAAMETMRANIERSMGREVAMRRLAQVQLADAIGTSTEGVLITDADGQIVVANPRLAALFPGIAAGSMFADVLARAPALAATGDLCLLSGTWLRVSRSETVGGGSVSIYGDITALKEREAELQSTNECFDAALNNMSQGLCLFDEQNRLRVANPQFAEMYGLDTALLRPGTLYSAILNAKARRGYINADAAAAHAALGASGTTGVFLHQLDDGRSISIYHEPLAGGGWVRTYEDVSERRRAEAQVAYLARHDATTGLPNRHVLAERIEHAAATLSRMPGHGFAVLAVGLHDFRGVSDLFGYAAAEIVLKSAAERLSGAVRESDLVVRLDADEFIVLQADVQSPDDAGELAGRLLDALAVPYRIEGREQAIDVSLGIAMAPIDGVACDALLRHADLALSRAKTDGRSTFRYFESDMDGRLRARRQMQQDLKHALAREEFELYYQPCVDVTANRVCGVEALLRWHHPERGMVSPADFIPVAEATGLIVEIGAWVLHQACREAAGWPTPVRVAVNVSPLQFSSPALVARVASALTQSGLPAARLELEVTESVLMGDDGATLATLQQLRTMGARVAMDDFGTGYSSLSTLRSFPFDKIKVDQSFVRALGADPGAAAIIRAIVGLGSTLGMRTTVEGVETPEQLDVVIRAGANEIQGYYFSRPVPGLQLGGVIDTIQQRLAPPPQPPPPLSAPPQPTPVVRAMAV